MLYTCPRRQHFRVRQNRQSSGKGQPESGKSQAVLGKAAGKFRQQAGSDRQSLKADSGRVFRVQAGFQAENRLFEVVKAPKTGDVG